MSYTKHNYQKGDELLASQLNDMDDQIALNEQTADTLVTVSNTQPSAAKNRVWVKATPSEIEIPTMEDLDEVNRHLNTLAKADDYTDKAIYDLVYDEDVSVSSSVVLYPLYSRVLNGETVKIVLTIPDASSILNYASIMLYEGSSYTTPNNERRLDAFNDGSGVSNGINQGFLTVTGNRAYIRFANFVSSGTVSVHISVYVCNHINRTVGRTQYYSDLINQINNNLFNVYYSAELEVSSETVLYPIEKVIPNGEKVLIAINISDTKGMNGNPSVMLYEGNSFVTAHDEKYLSAFNDGVGYADGWNYTELTTTGERSYIRFANFLSSGTVAIEVKIYQTKSKDDAINIPFNAFGDILPTQFKQKLESMEDDILIVCAGDSITAYVDTCDPQEDPSHCPPGQQYKDWIAQTQEYVNKNKPIYDRLDSMRDGNAVISKSGTWTSEVVGDTDPNPINSESSKSALTFLCDSNSAAIGFDWDTSKYKKCNIVFSKEPDGVLTKVNVGAGDGKALASLDRITWVEANGFSVNQRTNLEGYTQQQMQDRGIPTRERHRRIWMKAVDGVTDNIRITYVRDNSTSYSNSKMYVWGIEKYSNPSIFFDNVGRGGKQTFYQFYYTRNITNRNPDLILFEMPLINETRYRVTQDLSAYETFLNSTATSQSLRWHTNNYADCPLLFFVPHGRGGYFDDENRAIRWEPNDGNTDQPTGEPPAYMFFMKVYNNVKGWFEENENVAWFNMFNRLYDEALSKYGLYKEAFSSDGNAFSSDGTHLSQKGANVYTKYIAGIFTKV